MADPIKRSTSMSLDGRVLDEARRLGINLSRAAETGLPSAIREEKARRWRSEHAEAIALYNAYIDEKGGPLAGNRKF